MDQGPQGLWMDPKGPPDGAKDCSPPQELEKAREAGYFFSIIICVQSCRLRLGQDRLTGRRRSSNS